MYVRDTLRAGVLAGSSSRGAAPAAREGAVLGRRSFVGHRGSSHLGTSRPKLPDRVRHAIRARRLSHRTEDAYATWVRRFVLFYHVHHPAEMGEDIAISMDGRGRAPDNIFVERLWRSIKHEEIYLTEGVCRHGRTDTRSGGVLCVLQRRASAPITRQSPRIASVQAARVVARRSWTGFGKDENPETMPTSGSAVQLRVNGNVQLELGWFLSLTQGVHFTVVGFAFHSRFAVRESPFADSY